MTHIIDFRNPKTVGELSRYLGLNVTLLEQAISAGKAPFSDPIIYIRHKIPKKRSSNGGFRVVWDVADADIRDAHRAFARRFADFAEDVEPGFPHQCAYGYIRGRSIKDNAAMHAGRRLLLRCDIENFFASISANRLVSRFIQLGISPGTAQTLAGFATINNELALGLNASPVLANLVCSALDERLEQLAVKNDCVYTRYADDISISGNALPNYSDIVEIIESEDFRLSKKKMRITKRGQAHFVTGLSISDSVRPHVPRNYKRRLRQELYYCEKFGIREHVIRIKSESYQSCVNRLDGTVRFVGSIESTIASKIRSQWMKALASESAQVSYAPRHNSAGTDVTFLVDEAEFEYDGDTCLALACVATTQIDHLRTTTEKLLREYLTDPFSSGRKAKLRKKGLHFTDAPEDVRSDYALLLAFLSFRVYVAFGTLGSDAEYESRYCDLLSSLIKRRLMSCDRSRLTVVFEKNPRVSIGSLDRLVRLAYADLEKTDNRRPLTSPVVRDCSKQQELAISVPDALLGIFCRAFSSSVDSDLSRLRFERLRDKFRHIVNINNGQMFSRRHPIEW